jgi:protein-tyrosine-phosphatase/DNA-binding transcriptional ArsR family regulator
MTQLPAVNVPSFLGLASHPLRWRLLSELARSDRLVDELVARVGRPQGLVSYHLGRLRTGGLVSSRRSAKDGRAVYYRANLEQCGSALAVVGPSMHPGLGLQRTTLPATTHLPRRRPVRVLFACTGNSARSQIAAALLGRSAGAAVHVVSAGSFPKPVHPYAVRVLAERGIDIGAWRSKPLTEFADQPFDFVVTLCDKVREHCPEFDGGGEKLHWSIEDPSASADDRPVTPARFERLATDLDERVGWLRWLIDDWDRQQEEVTS